MNKESFHKPGMVGGIIGTEKMNKTQSIVFVVFASLLSMGVGCGQRTACEFEHNSATEIQASSAFYTHDTDLDDVKEIITLGGRRQQYQSFINIRHIGKNGQFSTTDSVVVNGAQVYQLCFNDFNDDGLLDFVTNQVLLQDDDEPTTGWSRFAGLYFETALFINRGDGGFKQVWTYRHQPAFVITTMTCADFMGDGNAYLMLGGVRYDIPNKQSTISIQLFTIGEDKLLSEWNYEVYEGEGEVGELMQIGNAYINDDGKQDFIALVNNRGRERGELLAFSNDGSGGFEKVWQNKEDDITQYFYGFRIADVNLDGYDDIVARLNNNDIRQMAFFMNNQDDTFTKTEFQTDNDIKGTLYTFDTGDFDADGDTDLVLATEEGENSWLSVYSNNDMSFKNVWEYHLLREGKRQDATTGYSSVYAIFAFDLDNDGKSEIGVATEHFQYNFDTEEESERIELCVFRSK